MRGIRAKLKHISEEAVLFWAIIDVSPTLDNSYSAILYNPFVCINKRHQMLVILAVSRVCNCAAVGYPPVNCLVVSGLRPS
jgi:hypothetical protein